MKYKVIDIVGLPAGSILGLSAAQVSARSHALAPIKGREGFYETTQNVQFKRGQSFIFIGDIPKHLAAAVESAEGHSGVELVKAQKQEATRRAEAKKAGGNEGKGKK